jgi:uncharacterized protein involved in exopolysaccharide biosynthesis
MTSFSKAGIGSKFRREGSSHTAMENQSQFTVKDYWRVITSHKWIILFSLLVSCSLALGVNEFTRPVYRATSQLMIQKEQTRSPLTGNQMETSSSESDSLLFDTAVELITSRPLMGTTIHLIRERDGIQIQDEPGSWSDALKTLAKATLEIADDYLPVSPPSPSIRDMSEAERAEVELNRRIDNLRRTIKIKPVDGTRLVNVSVEHGDPFVARTIANTVVNEFAKDQAHQRVEAYKQFAVYLDDELGQVKAKIAESERVFYIFKDHEGLYSLEGKLQELTRNIEDFNVSLVKTKTDRLAIEARLDKLKPMMKENGVKQWDKVPVESETMTTLRRDLLVAQTELAKNQEVYKSQHPKVKTLASGIEAIESSLRKELEHAVAGLKAEHEILKAREEQLAAAIAQSEREIHELNNKALQYSTLERDLDTNRELYNLLLAKLNDTDITGKVSLPFIRVTELAPLPDHPVRPRKAANLILSVVLGVMTGVGLAFFRDHLQQTIRTPADVGAKLHLPILGVIPKEASR